MQIVRRTFLFAAAIILGTVIGSGAQMGLGMRSPQIQGVWNPVVGSGAAYQVESKGDRKTELEMAVVGSETYEGKTGYWLEWTMQDPRSGGQAYMKQLIVLDGKQTGMKRMILQAPGQPPMEFPMQMVNRGGQPSEQSADARDRAERVGNESVTTPAGIFTCEHWRLKDGSGDVWISDKVAPWGLVKMTGRESNMTLVRIITGAKTHITGTPQNFDPMEMMRQRKNQ